MNATEAFELAMKVRRACERTKMCEWEREELRKFRAQKKLEDDIEELTKIIKELILKAAKEGKFEIEFDTGKVYYSEDVTFRVMKNLRCEGYSTSYIEEKAYYPYDVEDQGYLTDYEIKQMNIEYDASIYSISWGHVGRVK